MLRTMIIWAALAASLSPAFAELSRARESQPNALERLLAEGEFQVAQRRSCKAASTCEEAVQMWCDGYAGADRDNDGIPCEGDGIAERQPAPSPVCASRQFQ